MTCIVFWRRCDVWFKCSTNFLIAVYIGYFLRAWYRQISQIYLILLYKSWFVLISNSIQYWYEYIILQYQYAGVGPAPGPESVMVNSSLPSGSDMTWWTTETDQLNVWSSGATNGNVKSYFTDFWSHGALTYLSFTSRVTSTKAERSDGRWGSDTRNEIVDIFNSDRY